MQYKMPQRAMTPLQATGPTMTNQVPKLKSGPSGKATWIEVKMIGDERWHDDELSFIYYFSKVYGVKNEQLCAGLRLTKQYRHHKISVIHGVYRKVLLH